MALPTKTNTLNPRGQGYGVRIGDNYYRLALGATAGSMIQNIAQWRIRTEDDPEEIGGSDERSKTHAQTDFTSGEGLLYYYHPDNAEFDAARFWSSYGIFTEAVTASKYRLTQTGTPGKIFDPTSINAPFTHGNGLVADGTSLYAIENQRVAIMPNPDSASPVVSYETPSAGNDVRALALLGDNLWATTSAGQLVERTGTNTWAVRSTSSYETLWSAKGRLIVGQGRNVIEYGQGTVFSLPTGEAPTAVTDADLAVLVGGSDGYVYALRSEDGALTLKTQSNFEGEYITGLAAAKNLVLVGTVEHITDSSTARLYAAVLAPDYTLRNVQLYKEWTVEGRTRAPHDFTVVGSQVYFTVGDGQIWRLDLKTVGLFHHFDDPDDGLTLGAASVGDTLFWRNNSGNVYRQTTDANTETCYLITSLIDLADARVKMWQKFIAYRDGSGTLAVEYSTNPDAVEDPDHASWTSLTLTDDEAIVGAASRWIAFKLTLSGGASVRGYSVKAYPGGDDLMLRMPIQVGDRVERPGRQPVRIPGLGDRILASLWELEGSAVEVEFLEINLTVKGTVERVEHTFPALSGRSASGSVAMVTVSGERQ